MQDTSSNFRVAREGRPLIGVTMDVAGAEEGRLKVDCSLAYARCIETAGATPVMLPPILSLIGVHARLCDAFVLTGGDDPKMEGFGVPSHPRAKLINPLRQEYELGLLRALERERPEAPVLGVCLGMQLMALHAGGKLNQFLPDTLPTHAIHKDAEHRVAPEGGCSLIGSGLVWSNHRQAIEDAGSMVVVSRSEDGVIEAVADPLRRLYIGVQWHPERTRDPAVGQAIFAAVVRACRA